MGVGAKGPNIDVIKGVLQYFFSLGKKETKVFISEENLSKQFRIWMIWYYQSILLFLNHILMNILLILLGRIKSRL